MGILSKNYHAVSPGIFIDGLLRSQACVSFLHKTTVTVKSELQHNETKGIIDYALISSCKQTLSVEQLWDMNAANDLGLYFLLPQSYDCQNKKPALLDADITFSTGNDEVSFFISDKNITKSCLSLSAIGPTCTSMLFKQLTLKSLSALVQLDISCNCIDALPDDFGFYFVQLEKLSLKNNNLVKLPDSIGLMASLSSLALDNNKLQFLPESIGALFNLKSLSCKNNFLTFLPDSLLGPFSLLEYLDISHNPISFLPPILLSNKSIDIIAKQCPLIAHSTLLNFPSIIFNSDSHENKFYMEGFNLKSERNFYTSSLSFVDKGGPPIQIIYSSLKKYYDLPDELKNSQLPTLLQKLPHNLYRYLSSGYKDANFFHPISHPPVNNDCYEVIQDDDNLLFSYKKPHLKTGSKIYDGFFFQVPTLKEFAGRAVYAKLIHLPSNLPSLIKSYLHTCHTCSWCGGVYFNNWTPRFVTNSLSCHDDGDGTGMMLDTEMECVSLFKMCWPHWGDKQSKIQSLFTYSKVTPFSPYPAYGLEIFDVIGYWIKSVGVIHPNVKINSQRARKELQNLLNSVKTYSSYEQRFHNQSLCSKSFLLDPYIICNILFPFTKTIMKRSNRISARINDRISVISNFNRSITAFENNQPTGILPLLSIVQ